MIIKEIKKYLVNSEFVGQRISVKGFPFACIEFSVDTLAENDSLAFSLYTTKDGTAPTTSSERAVAYIGGKRIDGTYRISNIGKYLVYLDLTGVTNLYTAVSTVEGGEYSASLYLSQDPFEQEPIQRFFQTESSCTYETNGSPVMKIDLEISSENASNSTFTFVSGSKNLTAYVNGKRYVGSMILGNGKYEVVIDCRNVYEVTFSCTYTRIFFANIQFSDDRLLLLDSERIIDINVQTLVKDISAKQVDIDYHLTAAVPPNTMMYLEGSSDGSTWAGIDFVETQKNVYCSGSINIRSYQQGSIYANVESYSQIRLRFENPSNTLGSVYFDKIELHDEYVNGRNIPVVFANHRTSKLLKGYQYFKFKFAKEGWINGYNRTCSITNCSTDIVIRNSTEYIMGIPFKTLEQYDLAMSKVSQPTIGYRWNLNGTPCGGGFVYGLETPVQDEGWFELSTTQKLQSDTLYLVANCTMYVEKPEPEVFLKKVSEKKNYDVYQLPTMNQNKDVLFRDVLEWEDNKLIFYQGGYAGVKYEIPFGADNVAHYVAGETIKFAYLLPFNMTNRDASQSNFYGNSRICVFTNTRVYHNFPVRSGSINPNSDMFNFDESAVITPYKRFLVNDNVSAAGNYKYFPVLKDYDYSQFEGRIGTTGDADPYGNGGLPTDVVLQDIPDNNYQFWTRLRHSNMTKGFKMCCFGNYNNNVCSEPIVMVSTNGGRTWYVKAYFACTDYYNYMRGGRIDLNLLFDTISDYSYTSGDLKLCRKRFNIPTEADKEPSTPFILDAQDETLITSINYSNGDCIITTADNVDYDGVLPCVYFKNMSGNSALDYICNNNLQADGSGNTGIFFRVQKIQVNQYKLYADLGNANEGYKVCRHIHAVNAIEAGILISTGESYNEGWFEGGFMYVLSQIGKNGTGEINPALSMQCIRLNSTPKGCNRASGAFLFSDNADPTLLYVSDEAFVTSAGGTYSEKRYASLPDGRTEKLPITPGGIYVGKLSDVDDQSKFKCVCEAGHTVVGLVEKNSHFGADLHPNGIALSHNGFDWNIEIESMYNINGYDNQGNIYFGDKVAVFK